MNKTILRWVKGICLLSGFTALLLLLATLLAIVLGFFNVTIEDNSILMITVMLLMVLTKFVNEVYAETTQLSGNLLMGSWLAVLVAIAAGAFWLSQKLKRNFKNG